MNFLRFLKNESLKPLHKVLVMAGISGISNAILLAIINAAAGGGGGTGGAVEAVGTVGNSQGQLNFRYLLMFAVSLTLFIVCQKYILHESTTVIENILARVRMRLSGKIQKADLLNIENIGQSEIYNRLTQETILISNSAPLLILAVQSIIMLFFVAFYIAILSKTAFFLIVILLLSAIYYYLKSHKKLQTELQKANKVEMVFFESLSDSLDGMKETRLDQKRSRGLLSFLENTVGKLENLKISTGIKYLNNNIFAQSFYYFLIGVIVFILPRIYPSYSEDLTQIIAAVLFTIGPTGVIVGAVQTFDRVEFAVTTIYRLEGDLEKIIEIYEDDPQYNKRLKDVKTFSRLRLKNLEFSYKDHAGNDAFSIGPINLEIQSGETLFIVGGNGSGKTTLLKVLCMLYYPDNGSISLDDIKVEPSNAVDYRQLFSAVFSDFHLFSRLYGMEDTKQEKVEELLKIMELDKKTKFLGDRFSTLDLSTGQRKRLALLISLLEDKPIYIFDEWAADQDPGFRKYFYEVILTKLKENGKTIVAASHDDRFFHFADKVIELDYGKVAKES